MIPLTRLEINLGFNVIVGGGDEYEAIADIKATNATYILPINFPDAYDVSNPYQADYVTLADMRNLTKPCQSKDHGRQRSSLPLRLTILNRLRTQAS